MSKLMMRRTIYVPIMILACFFSGCADPPPPPYPTFAPSTMTTPLPMRPYITVQFCNDDTGSYPREDFVNANALIAAGLIHAVRSNQSGITLYATAITHNTFEAANTLKPAFLIPAIPAYPALPMLMPTPTAFNPVSDRATKVAVITNDNSLTTAYNVQVQAIDKQVQTQTAAMTQDVNRLKTWNPPVDNIATSILGCLEVARSNFQNQTGSKVLYIASDLENNTSIDYTQELVKSHGLDGVIIHTIFYYSENAARAQEKINQWCPFFKAAGAKSVVFDERAKSAAFDTIDLFTADTTATEKSC